MWSLFELSRTIAAHVVFVLALQASLCCFRPIALPVLWHVARSVVSMWCPVGEELLDAGYAAGEDRLGHVVPFLNKQELTCLDDFIGLLGFIQHVPCAHFCVEQAFQNL